MKQPNHNKLFAALLAFAFLASLGGAFAIAPTVSNVSAESTATTSAVTWNTNQTAYSNKVLYGLTSALGATATTAVNGTSHSITLTGLASNELYYYLVQSCDTGSGCTNSSASTFMTECSSDASIGCDMLEGLPAAGENVGGFITGLIPGVIATIAGLGVVFAVVMLFKAVAGLLRSKLK